MQNFTKVPFKMPEIFPHTLGRGLEIWDSIYRYVIFQMYMRKTDRFKQYRLNLIVKG